MTTKDEVLKQEPVALVIDGVLVKSELPEKYTGHLYTSQQRQARSADTWVGLTDWERDDVLDNYFTDEGRAQAIEAKLREKNT